MIRLIHGYVYNQVIIIKLLGANTFDKMMAKFSLDLSLLATTNKNLIILWKNYNQHVYTLTHPSIKQLHNFFFINNSAYLLSYNSNYLYIWNLLSCEIYKTYQFNSIQYILKYPQQDDVQKELYFIWLNKVSAAGDKTNKVPEQHLKQPEKEPKEPKQLIKSQQANEQQHEQPVSYGSIMYVIIKLLKRYI